MGSAHNPGDSGLSAPIALLKMYVWCSANGGGVRKPINLVYILGEGRSGSTLMDLLISCHPAVTGLGEMKMFHRYVDRSEKARHCTCQCELACCPVWGPVLREQSHDYTLSLDSPTQFAERNYDLLSAVATRTNAAWLCDSSKDVNRLQSLMLSQCFNLFVIHLVRDPRAVAYSNVRKRRRKLENCRTFTARVAAFRNYNYWKSIVMWKRNMVFCRSLLARYDRHRLVSYEDMVDDYRGIIGTVWEQLSLDCQSHYFDQVRIDAHNIGGNHLRREVDLSVRKDTEYLDRVGDLTWLLSSIYLRRELRTMRYPFRRHSPAAPTSG